MRTRYIRRQSTSEFGATGEQGSYVAHECRRTWMTEKGAGGAWLKGRSTTGHQYTSEERKRADRLQAICAAYSDEDVWRCLFR